MAREKTIIANLGGCIALERVEEKTTIRQNLPDGGIIRTDGKGFWITPFGAYYGQTPPGWDRRRAYYEDFSRSYEFEADYS